ncbi:MAG: SDR family oxidoreductase [Gaiellales bacterium]|nr:SDR family oxidoreductase [Gaiellales bacterium]
MRVLVTGGGGFIGSNLVGRLLQLGHEVAVLDNFLTGRRENLAPYNDAVELFEEDIRDLEGARRAVTGREVVYHQAALPSVPRSVEDPVLSNSINVDGTLNVLLACRDAGVRRVVMASSSSVYGDSETLPKTEDMATAPKSPYGASKLATEAYGRAFHAVYGLEVVSLRYFNVFGPRQDPQSHYAAVIPRFITALLEDRRPTVFGDGEQTRDFTYVDNVVQANLLAGAAPEAPGLALNLAGGHRYSLNYLLELVRGLTGSTAQAVYEPARPGDIKHSQAGIDLAQRVLDFSTVVDFEEGIRRTVDWYRAGEETKPAS